MLYRWILVLKVVFARRSLRTHSGEASLRSGNCSTNFRQLTSSAGESSLRSSCYGCSSQCAATSRPCSTPYKTATFDGFCCQLPGCSSSIGRHMLAQSFRGGFSRLRLAISLLRSSRWQSVSPSSESGSPPCESSRSFSSSSQFQSSPPHTDRCRGCHSPSEEVGRFMAW